MTISGGTPRGPARAPGRGAPPLLVAGVLLAAVAVIAVTAAPPVPPTLRTVTAQLRLVEERVASSSGGVFVLPLELASSGAPVTVDGVVVFAAPVRSDPTTSGRLEVDAAGSARFVALVQPDCALLRSGSGIELTATAAVRLHAAGATPTEVVVDLGGHPVVAARVRALCRAPA